MQPLEINLPQNIDIIDPAHEYSNLTKEEIIEQLKSDELKTKLQKPAIIIINDHHRSTPSGRILEALYDLYGEIANVDFIVIASGTHEEPSNYQISQLTHRTEELFDCEVLIHDPLEQEVEMINIGITSRGTQVKIHPVILDYDNIVCINSVEPHYFAGFTGGIKSIVPGLAAKSTVESNHRFALVEESQPTRVEDNPLQIDLWEAGMMTGKEYFGIQLVNFQTEIYSISIGNLREAFDQARKVSLELYHQSVTKQYDVIVSVVYPPLDRSVYQAQKGIENTRQALKVGGEFILVAKCEHGIGNTAFYETVKSYSSPDEIIEDISIDTYQFGDHKAYNFATLVKNHKLTFVGELGLTEARNLFATTRRFDELEEYLGALARAGKSILMVMDSGTISINYSE